MQRRSATTPAMRYRVEPRQGDVRNLDCRNCKNKKERRQPCGRNKLAGMNDLLADRTARGVVIQRDFGVSGGMIRLRGDTVRQKPVKMGLGGIALSHERHKHEGNEKPTPSERPLG